MGSVFWEAQDGHWVRTDLGWTKSFKAPCSPHTIPGLCYDLVLAAAKGFSPRFGETHALFILHLLKEG